MNFKSIATLGTHPLMAIIVGVMLLAACVGKSNTSEQATPTLALFAGDLGGPGNNDDIGAAARFTLLYGIATDSAGNVYVTDNGNCAVRKITPAGVVSSLAGQLSWCAGVFGTHGTDDTGTAARFNRLFGATTDRADNVYVIDSCAIRKIAPTGVVSTLAGSWLCRNIDGIGTAASFNNPSDIVADSAGNIYVRTRDEPDDYNKGILRKITPDGAVSTMAHRVGQHITIDSAGNFYTAISSAVIKIAPTGAVSTLAGSADLSSIKDGTGTAASFSRPVALTTDSADNVYVTDDGTVRKITPAGVVSTLAGRADIKSTKDGTGAAASFSVPGALATDSAGNVYVTDGGTIRKITPAGVVGTLAGSVAIFGSADGTGAAARFMRLGTSEVPAKNGIAVDNAGNVYMADTSNHTIRKITPAGAVSTLAGTAAVFGNADGTGASAEFFYPSFVATDGAGNVYVTDTSRTIRKITPVGVVSTFAGSPGLVGHVDGIGTAARFFLPSGIAVDSTGNIYVADTSDAPPYLGVLPNATIRKITPAGAVSTLAGSPGLVGHVDGTGAAARFYDPQGVATDGAGNIYVGDAGTIRKITPAGVVSTLAGTAFAYGNADGTGAAARFSSGLRGITADSAGNLYVADVGNIAADGYTPTSTIRKITQAGVVTTVAGAAGKVGFVAGPLPGSLAYPYSVAISGTSLYIALAQGIAVVKNVP